MTVIQLPRWRSVSKRVGGVVYQSQGWNTRGGDVVYQNTLKGGVVYQNNFKGGVVYQKNPLLCPDDDQLTVTQVTRLPCCNWSPNSTVLHLDIYLCKYTNLKTQQGNLLHTCARLEHSTDPTSCVSHPRRLVAIDLNGDALHYISANVHVCKYTSRYIHQTWNLSRPSRPAVV